MRNFIAEKHKEIIRFRTFKTRKATVSVPHDWRNNGFKCTVVNRGLLAIALLDGSLEKHIFKISVSEFNEFEPRLKTANNRFQLSAGLNLETLNIIISETNHIWAAG